MLPDSAPLPVRTGAPESTGSVAAFISRDAADTVGDDSAAVALADTFFEGSEEVWMEARTRGVTFRAVGQEPGWLVELGQNETMRVVVDYGAREMEFALPEPVVDSTRWVTSYRVRTQEHTVRVDIRDEPCADVMSGERFSATVLLLLDGERFSGCGRTLTLP